MTLRIAIEPVVAGTKVPMQEVAIAITPRSDANVLTLDFAPPRVRPADGSPAGSTSELIGQQISKLIKPLQLPNARDFNLGPGKRIRPKLSDFGTSNGWLLIAID